MKTMLLSLLLSISTFCLSQNTNPKTLNEDDLLNKKMFDEATHIFEGTVLESKTFKAIDGNYYLKQKVKVHKIFKGIIKNQIVVLNTETHDYEFFDSTLGRIVYLPTASHPLPSINIGRSGLFISYITPIKERDFNDDKKYMEKEILSGFGYIYYNFFKDRNKPFVSIRNWSGSLKFDSVNLLYNYLKTFGYNIKIDFDNIKFRR